MTALHSLYENLGKKDHAEFTEKLIEKNRGTKKDISSFLLKAVNCSLDCKMLLKNGCPEVDGQKLEALSARKELDEVQSELMTSKRE